MERYKTPSLLNNDREIAAEGKDGCPIHDGCAMSLYTCYFSYLNTFLCTIMKTKRLEKNKHILKSI